VELLVASREAIQEGNDEGKIRHDCLDSGSGHSQSAQSVSAMSPTECFALSGHTVLVTGSSRNIGRAIALAFAEAGIAVGVNANQSLDEAQAVVAEITEAGGRAALAMGNVASPADCARIVAEVEGQLGPIDYMVHNAARRRYQAFADMTPEMWDETIQANLSSMFYLSRLVLPGMRTRGFGRILALGGPDGYLGWHHRPGNVTAKAGLTGIVKAISFEYCHFGVTANIVVPGGTDTTRRPEDYPPDMLEAEGVPQGAPVRMIPRQGTVEELASACIYLASDAAGYITGQSLHVDGGLVMR
jgi:3-oxoacyl-[acyl-carrier protein] reductase